MENELVHSAHIKPLFSLPLSMVEAGKCNPEKPDSFGDTRGTKWIKTWYSWAATGYWPLKAVSPMMGECKQIAQGTHRSIYHHIPHISCPQPLEVKLIETAKLPAIDLLQSMSGQPRFSPWGRSRETFPISYINPFMEGERLVLR